MPVDYSKWDKLEISDDEDIECHPNIDKASMIRWHQAAVHRQRRERRDKISTLELETTLNDSISKILKEFSTDQDDVVELIKSFMGICSKIDDMDREMIKKVAIMWNSDRDPRWGPPEPDEVLNSKIKYGESIKQLTEKLQKHKEENPDFSFNTWLRNELDELVERISKRQVLIKKEIEKEREEQNKKITSENMYTGGFDKTIINKPKPAPKPEEPKTKKTHKKEKVIETIHTPSADAKPKDDDKVVIEKEDDDDESYITYGPAREFSHIKDFEKSYKFISEHPEIVDQKYQDEILSEAFHAQMNEKPKYARSCVQQSLIIQYCKSLGSDGISLFFKRMITGFEKAQQMFMEDVDNTYNHIVNRVKILKEKREAEEAEEKRQIEARLKIAEQPDGTYIWPMDENPSEEEKKKAETFATFTPDIQKALLTMDPDDINAILAKMTKEEGQELIRKCSESGLIQFVEDDEDEGDLADNELD